MAEENKKKGFWSWLGFGKKASQEQQTEQNRLEEQPSQAVETTALSEEQPVERAEKVTPPTDEALPEIEPNTPLVEIEEIKAEEAEPKPANEVLPEIEPNTPLVEVAETKPVEVEPRPADEALPEIEPNVPLVEAAEVKAEEVESQPADEALPEIEPNAPLVEAAEVKAEEVEPQPADEALPEIEPNVPLAEAAEVKPAETEPQPTEAVETYPEKPAQEGGFFSRLIKGLIKTKQNIGSGFLNLFRGKKIDDELFEELEEQLLVADLGMPTTTKIINNLIQHASKKQLQDAELLYQQLKQELAEVLKPVAQPLVLSEKKPYVILMVGVNGVGKTTTIGKLARKFQAEGKSVMLAAGDTFRAAAVEQLQVWGERNHIPVVAQSTGADSASVIFDAMQSAAAKGVDVLIADTAGRLQNKQNLMDELKKIVRVMKKYDDTAPHEIMLTLDAGTGQNAISQAKLFNEAVGLTGITLTKLDGTAKGGVIFAIADQFNIPIRYIGVGEKIEELRSFDADEFIEALFDHEGEK
ncbi:cell division protein FtsY [[Actinobacillus] muris]|uniref:Signal recognition particle receptor FtsY n=1 Tax=Muribacter muris TaxID=67855 RepID=A0A0J5P4L1_9PAST|nr:signal recognition particle-docking protein FtsY [Muribacter muris]KMK51236.1 cell division protein FtsY [[Actinobacillus] muris] [Muribacter muris]